MQLAYYYLFMLRPRRRYWVHAIYGSRPNEGEYHTLMTRLRADPEEFFKYFRMDEAAFDKLLGKIRPRLAPSSRYGPATDDLLESRSIRIGALSDRRSGS